MQLCDERDCVGCFACKNVCPQNAISVAKTDEKKTIPKIDAPKCVSCGLCRKVCPELTESEFREPLNCYAAWTKVESDRIDCASGGVATALSRLVIRRGGVVFGAAYTNDLNVEIIMAKNEDELERLKGSKYVQCDTANSYQLVLEQLKKDLEVLYIGTPCQIDGLLHFLRKPYDNLYTVDIICHGVPPIDYLKEYMHELLPGKKVDEVQFRGKYNYYLTAINNEKIIYQKRDWEDLYYDSFLKGIIYRDNCYQCKYAKNVRISDISIGDFWGIDRKTLSMDYDGRISVILSNTDKGEDMISKSLEVLYLEKRAYEEAKQSNRQLNKPMEVPNDRKLFLENLDIGIYKSLTKTSLGESIFANKKRNGKLRKIAKKILKRN